MSNADYVESLRQAIRRLYGCVSKHSSSIPVKETFNGQTVWDGVVEVFDLIDCPNANRCYAWSYAEGKETKYYVVLEIPPVNSAKTAVQASIVADHRKK